MGDDIATAVRRGIFTAMVWQSFCGPPAADRADDLNKVEPPKGDYIGTAA